MTREALIVRHSDVDGPGAIARELGARQVAMREVRGYDGGAVPDSIGDAAALIVMGAPMSVVDELAHPFLAVEKQLIASAVAAHVPVLGVCLGAQLVATVLGGGIRRADVKGIGWYEVERAASDLLFDVLPPRFTPFHWHEDAIALPPGSTLLARSALTDVQAFRRGETLGVQFHLESDAAMIDAMVHAFEREQRDESLDLRALEAETRAHLAEQERFARLLFGIWAEAIATGISP